MRSSDSLENDPAPGWEKEVGSDNKMDPAVLVRVKESPEHVYDQDTDGEADSP